MSRYSLDYALTCPSLDSEISDAKGTIESHFTDTLLELNPLMDQLLHTPELREWIKTATEALYSDLEPIFENCRTVNEDIRSAADNQIAECVNEIEEAEYRIKELEGE